MGAEQMGEMIIPMRNSTLDRRLKELVERIPEHRAESMLFELYARLHHAGKLNKNTLHLEYRPDIKSFDNRSKGYGTFGFGGYGDVDYCYGETRKERERLEAVEKSVVALGRVGGNSTSVYEVDAKVWHKEIRDAWEKCWSVISNLRKKEDIA